MIGMVLCGGKHKVVYIFIACKNTLTSKISTPYTEDILMMKDFYAVKYPLGGDQLQDWLQTLVV